MTRSVAVLLNPAAGRGRSARAAALVVPRLEQSGLRVQQLQGRTATEAAEQADGVARAGVDALVVIGGDGMVHLALQALGDADIPVGVIPTGSGNDVARLLGVDRTDPVPAADAIIGGATRRLDLADVAGTRVVTVVATGFDSRVNERANAMRWPAGQLRYTIATLAELRVFEPVHYSLELDGSPYQMEAMLVAVGNGPSYGGGLRICEGARPHDGLLDVVVIRPLSKVELVRVYPRLFTGSHVRHRAYEHHRVRTATVAAPGLVAYGDGERLGPLPITVRVVPGSVRFFVPSDRPGPA
ncbi:MAG: YegS/Rv2252/BmrU family lipid kinase [Actinomycetota bacterium]|nr:YegS/Rv2252/BmrU family lipid kinase [Actinomycetota bacterium]